MRTYAYILKILNTFNPALLINNFHTEFSNMTIFFKEETTKIITKKKREERKEGEKEKKKEARRQPKGNVGKPDCKAEPSRATGLLKELQT